MASPAAVLSILVTANTSQATRGIMRLNTTLGATESSANKALGAIKTMTKGAAIGAGVGIGYAVKKAADFEQQLDSLGSVSGATGKEMERFRKQAMKAGADTKFSALDAAKAQTELAKGGASVAQIAKGGLRSALALAAAGELDLALAAETSANAMNLFGLRGKDAMKVADQLATAANATTADVEDFAMALKMGGSVAKMAGLSFGETVLSLEALAKIGIRNSDAGTSLKTAIIQLLKPTAKQKELADKLNLSFVDQEGHFKSMADISKMLRDRLGGMTDAQRTATLATLAGTDGVRTLSALYDAGPAKLNKWKAGLEKSGTAAKVAAEKQDNLKGKLENLQGSIETVAISLGSKLLPALTDAAEKVTDVINDPKLTGAEKFDKLGTMAAEAIGKTGPVVAAAAAKVGLVAVRGFFNAFRESPLWLKLITTAFLLKRFGVFSGVWKQAGVKAGAQTAAGVAEGVAAGTTPGKFGKARAALGSIGKRFLGVALAVGIADAITAENMDLAGRIKTAVSTTTLGIIPPPKGTAELLAKLTEQFKSGKLVGPKDLIDTSTFDKQQMHLVNGMRNLRKTADRMFGPGQRLVDKAWANPERAQKQLRNLVDSFGRMRDGAVVKVSELRHSINTNFKAIADTMGVHSKRGRRALQTDFDLNLKTIRHFVKDGTLSADQGGKLIARLMKVHSKEGKEGLARNLLKSEKAIAASMTRHGKITDDGTKLIRQLMILAMKGMGLSADTIRMSINKRESAKHGPVQPGQTGMIVRGGKPVGDSVHAILERGEVVVNRKAVQRLGGPEKVNRLNHMIPRFATGGIAGMTAAANKLDAAQFPYVWGGGHQGSPAPFGPMDCSGAVSFVLQHGGVKIPTMVSGALAGAGSPGPGKVTVFANQGHTFMRIGNRYFGTSGTNPGGGAGWFSDPGAAYKAGFAQRHFKGVGGFANVPRVTVTGQNTALKSVVQGALDNTRRGANRKLDSLLSTSFGGGDVGDPGPGFGKGELKNLWVRANNQLGDANLMAAIALAESGGDPNAHNPSGASGLWQILGLPFPGDPFDPMTNARMAGSKLLSQGLGAWEAYTNGNYAQYLQHGGVVASMQRGGLPGMLNRAVNVVGGLNKKGKRFPQKMRSRALHKFLDRIKKIDLPPNLQKNLSRFQKDADIFGDMADRAGVLTIDDPDGNPIQGVVGGLTEGEWLTKQLEALFKLRNALLRAEKIVAEKREKIVRLVTAAQKRLKALAVQLRAANKIKRGLETQLKQAQKHPRKNATLIKALKGQIKDVNRDRGVLSRERGVLKGRILPALTGRRDMFGTALREDIRPGIEAVQGLGSPMKVLRSLPQVGVLGGDILATQIRLRDLNEKPAISDATDDTGRADLLAELLREANLRTSVSQAQYDVFRNMPVFHQGGVMPGVVGREGMAVVRAGEGVFTPEQMAAMGSGDVVVRVVVEDGAVDKSKIRAEVEKATRQMSRTPSLPGRGGGLQR